MADIRQNTVFKDDFNRADESPLSGGGNWGALDTGTWTPCDLNDLEAKTKSGSASSMSYWTPETFDNDDAEAWGSAVGGNASGIAWGIGLFQQPGGSGQADGYRFRQEVGTGGPGYWLYKVTNGGSTDMAHQDPGGSSGDPGLLLIRRNGDDVECWAATLLDGSDFTMVLSEPDTDYTTGLYLGLGCTDNSVTQLLGWDWFGGGPAIAGRTQIYRVIHGTNPVTE